MRLWTALAMSGAFGFRSHFSARDLKRGLLCWRSLEIKMNFQEMKMGRLLAVCPVLLSLS